MASTVDVLFLVALLSSLLKAGDLLLREKQKRWIEDRVETLTLWLEYTNPLKWFSRLRSTRAQFILLSIGIVEFVGFILFATLTSYGNLSPIHSPQEWVNRIGPILAGLLATPFVLRIGGPRVIRWLLHRSKLLSFIFRFLVLVLVGFAVFSVYIAMCLGVASLFGALSSLDEHGEVRQGDSLAEWVFLWGMLLITPLFVSFWILTQVGGIVLWFCLLLWICQMLVIVARAFAWRVTEHSKGAYAAILLLATVALGVASLLLKRG